MSQETPPPQSKAAPPGEPAGAPELPNLDDPESDRISLRGLGPVSPSVDLARTVPEIINRRSRGRFFGRKRLSDRLPLEWLSLTMLLLLAAIYAVLKLFVTS